MPSQLTGLTLSLSLAGLIVSTLLIRRLWLLSKVEEYALNALYYCHKNKLSVVVADEMSQIWPVGHILLEVWRWDFSRYIVHQDHLEAMNTFIAGELERKNLALTEFEEEQMGNNLGAGDTPQDSSRDTNDSPVDSGKPKE